MVTAPIEMLRLDYPNLEEFRPKVFYNLNVKMIVARNTAKTSLVGRSPENKSLANGIKLLKKILDGPLNNHAGKCVIFTNKDLDEAFLEEHGDYGHDWS